MSLSCNCKYRGGCGRIDLDVIHPRCSSRSGTACRRARSVGLVAALAWGGRAWLLAANIVALTFALTLPTAVRAAEHAGIVGRWKALDEDLRTTRAIIDIDIDGQGQQIVGRIVELLVGPGEDPDPVCEKCQGTDRDRRIRGLGILFVGPLAANGEYRGRILDPEEGTVYRCVVTVDSGGNRLTIRGYIGIPLLGRTQTWVRVGQ
jgi:uncharacterized protein (DUF2147 family)